MYNQESTSGHPQRKWSNSLKNQTLDSIHAAHINPLTGMLHLKNLNGMYGYITADDLLIAPLIIHTHPADERYSFNSPEDIIAAGWVID